MEDYFDPFSKIALTLTASQLAKNIIVKEEGVGEDLSFNFFAWRNGTPFVCVQLESQYMKENHRARFGRCYELLRVLRFKLGVSALTFVAEGYVSTVPQERELSLAFIDPESKVKECLTIIHCDENLYTGYPDIYLFSIPYKYGVGKKVKWGNVMEFSQKAAITVNQYAYPSMLQSAFRRTIDPETSFAPLDNDVINDITKHGFLLQEF